MGSTHRLSAAFLCLLLAAALTPPGHGQESPAPAPAEPAAESAPAADASEDGATAPLLTLASVTVRGPVEGEPLADDTLARLAVRITNRGEEYASALAFTVEVAGQELPVYVRQVFLKPVPPGETVELALYNFWTSETGRPAPADGKLAVEVTLREAQWMKRTEEEGVEVWTPLGPIEGLPSAAATTVELKKKS